MKKLCLTILNLLFAVTSGHTQSISFLGIDTNPRTAAMGSSGISLESDAFSVYTLPAGAVFSRDRTGLGYSYTPWMSKITKGSNLNVVAGYVKFGKRSSVSAGFRHFTEHRVTNTDNSGVETGTFKPKHYTIDLAYAYALSNRFAVSTGLRFVNSHVSNTEGFRKASAVGFDAGMFYRSGIGLTAAFTLTNAGGTLDYGVSKVKMPLWVKAGTAYTFSPMPRHRFTGSFELDYQVHNGNNGVLGGVGIEYTLNNFISARGGYRFGDEDKTSPSYWTAGAGVRLGPFRVDFAYILIGKDSPLRNTFRISAQTKF